MAHQSNSHGWSAATRARIGAKIRVKLQADEAVWREERFEHKLERIEERDNAKELREIKHAIHEQNRHEDEAVLHEKREKERMDERAARAEKRKEHRRNRH